MDNLLTKVLKNSIGSLTKDQIASFLNIENCSKVKKDELITRLKDHLNGNMLLQHRLYKEYKSYFGMHPKDVEDLLKCTKLERQKWTAEGKLIVVKNEPFRAYGKSLNCPYYDALQVYSLTQSEITNWRTVNEALKKENLGNGIKQRTETIKKHESMRKNFRKEFNQVLASWYKIDSQLGVTFELAFWAVWTSRWAKSNTLKAETAKSPSSKCKYKNMENELYEIKNEVIKLLLMSQYKNLGLYRPENPDKVYLHLCDTHYHEWCQIRSYIYMDKWDYFSIHKKQILKCPRCNIDIKKDYYSLYYISIEDERVGDYKFNFHIPCYIGKDFFGEIENIPLVNHEEGNGLFRFGRPLFDEEKIIYTEKMVIKRIKEVIEKYKLYYT